MVNPYNDEETYSEALKVLETSARGVRDLVVSLSCEQTTARQQQDKPNLKSQQVVDRDTVFARLLVPSVTRRHFPHYCPLHPGVAIMSAAVTSATCGPGTQVLFTALPSHSNSPILQLNTSRPPVTTSIVISEFK